MHLCLVFEALGTSAASMVLELPCNQPLRLGHEPRYPIWIAKRILKHCLLGLSFLHQNGVVHGDVQPGNLLFVPQSINDDADKLEQDPSEDGVSQPVMRLDGRLDRWAPRYIVTDEPLTEFVDVGPGLTVKISDMGAG
jgi:serine/threonine protein kinase